MSDASGPRAPLGLEALAVEEKEKDKERNEQNNFLTSLLEVHHSHQLRN